MDSRVLEKINGPRYDFLRADSTLGDRILFLALSGSYGYGTSNINSDIDLRGFLVEGDDVLFKLSSFEQFECRETDTVIYGLKKFITLALNGNPQIIELLGLPEDCMYIMKKEGKLIYDNSDIFLSKKIIKTFGNYAMAQLRRIENALCHDSYDDEKREIHLLNSLKSQIEDFNENNYGDLHLYIDENQKEIFIKGNVNELPLRSFINLNSSLSNIVVSYKKLNHRNNKKDEKKLYKHAMHLIRLLITGQHILEGKGIVTRLDEHIPLFISIKNGELSFGEIFDLVRKYEKDFSYSARETNLRDNPDQRRAEELMMEIYKSYMFR